MLAAWLEPRLAFYRAMTGDANNVANAEQAAMLRNMAAALNAASDWLSVDRMPGEAEAELDYECVRAGTTWSELSARLHAVLIQAESYARGACASIEGNAISKGRPPNSYRDRLFVHLVTHLGETGPMSDAQASRLARDLLVGSGVRVPADDREARRILQRSRGGK